MDHTGTFPGLANLFRLIIDGLRKTVPEHQTKNPASCALVGVIWTSLGRRLERFGRILARVAAGIPDPVWPSRAGRPAEARIADPGSDGGKVADGNKQKPRMPTRTGWLMIMMPWVVAPYGTQLRHWLTDPDAEALVRSSRQMRRLLRPLLRSLSTDALPACLLEPLPEAASDVGPVCRPEAVSDTGESVAAGVARARAGRVSRRGARVARRAVTAALATSDVAQDAFVPPASRCEPTLRSAWIEPPPPDWWRVQDERRRAALAIARGSVCRV